MKMILVSRKFVQIWQKRWAKANIMLTLMLKMAQFELTLLDWAEAHKGARKYVAFAGQMLACIPVTVWI